ncbi:MAG: MFS transporter [Caldilineaceae bacterium]
MNHKRLYATAWGHFSNDVLTSSVAVILTVILRNDLHSTTSQIGFGVMCTTFAAALTQPLFGILADHWRGRWLGAASIAWSAIFFALAAFMPSYPLLITCLTVGALGSGAFHPVGMINASYAGGSNPTTATSIFFFLGQSGLALGPFVAGLMTQFMDFRLGMLLMALGMLPAIVLMTLHLNTPIELAYTKAEAKPTSATQAAQRARHRNTAIVVMAFVLFIAARAATTQTMATLLPKYFADQAYLPSVYGAMIGVFSFAGAIGTFVGGYLGDRMNRRLLLFISALLSVPFCYLMLHADGQLFFVAAALAGSLLNIPHSILLVMAQRLLPARQGMIGGSVLGFMFVSGAAFAWIASWFADRVGLPTVLTVLAFVPLLAALSALFLPPTRPVVVVSDTVTAPAAAD